MPSYYPIHETQTHIEIRDGAIYQVVKAVTHQSPDMSAKHYCSTFLGMVERGAPSADS